MYSIVSQIAMIQEMALLLGKKKRKLCFHGSRTFTFCSL